MEFYYKVLSVFRSWVGLILPVFAKAGDFRQWGAWVWRTLYVLLMIAVLVALYWLSGQSWITSYLMRRVRPELQPLYLPAGFLLLHALMWLGYWFWRLLGQDEAAAEFPDVEAAWNEAVRKLEASGIGVPDAPLFLILGRPAAGEDVFFQAAQVETTVRAPAADGAPLRVYAHRDAIFVTCAGASAWGQFAALLAGDTEVSAAAPLAQPIDKTIQFGEQLGLPPDMLKEMRELVALRDQRPLTPEENERLRQLFDLSNEPRVVRRRVSLGADEQTRGTSRLRFLCRLIARDRRPWCPINGMLLLIPWAATESDEAVKEASSLLQRELAAARSALQLRSPVFGLVCDLETARGFAEFRGSFPPERLVQRLGKGLPLVPDLPPAEVPPLIEKAAQWIGQSVLPMGIMEFLRLEKPADARKTPTTTNMHNRNLYMLLREVYTRGPRLAKVLGRGLLTTNEPTEDPLDAMPLFGGCYLAGTGRQAEEQAFVPRVFQRMIDGQNSVSWTGEALADDARYWRRTTMGYSMIAVAVIAGAIAGMMLWKNQTPVTSASVTFSEPRA